MATKLAENPKAKPPKSPRKSSKSPRSASPNNVLINGQIIDKQSCEQFVLPKRMMLDNILEESDPLFQDLEHQRANIEPLEDTVKKADENVQRFIQEMANNIEKNDTYFKTICQSSREELRGLHKFLSTIDDASKNIIVDTLMNVYKTDILSRIKENAPKQEPQDKLNKFKNVCKGLINEHHKKSVSKNISAAQGIANAGCQYARFDYIAANMAELSGISGSSSNQNDAAAKSKISEATKKRDIKDKAYASGDRNKPLNLHTNFAVNYQTKRELSADSFQPNNGSPQFSLETLNDSKNELLRPPSDVERFENPFRTDIFGKKESNDTVNSSSMYLPNVKKIYANLPVEIRHSKEQAINRILGKARKGPIAKTEYIVRTFSKTSPERISPRSVSFYDKTKTLNEDPEFLEIEQFVSEGVQASLPKKHHKLRKNVKNGNLNYVKPYRYRYESSYESQSDIALNCPIGYQLKLKKSKSDTDLQELKASKKTRKKHKEQRAEQCLANAGKQLKSSLIEVRKKSSTELIKAKDMRRHKKLINYLDKNLKRGDSEFQFSQILFEKPNKNMDNDASFLEIPSMDQKQVDAFNANYLLHALKIRSPIKTDILPKSPLQYFTNSASELSISEEDYRRWLSQRNWAKYSNVAHELKSLEQLHSISETAPPTPTKDVYGDYAYFLERGDYTPKSSAVERASTILSELSETFLYEHVVISRVLNFFLTFNAQRTRTLSKWDRGVQVLFFALFYCVWIYFSKYVFVEPNSKKGAILWK